MSVDVLLSNYAPLISALLFYAFVFTLGELSRRVVERTLRRNTSLYVFLIESIASAQMCTCVYENGSFTLATKEMDAGIVLKHYGVLGFFVAVALLGITGARLNRGAFVSPLAPIEAFYYGLLPLDRLLVLLGAQVLGGYSAFRIASHLWFYSASLSAEHAVAFANPGCALRYHVDLPLAIAFEIIGCFLIRLLIAQFSDNQKPIVVPVIISSFLSFAWSFVGVPALNPLTTSSRLFGCSGLSSQTFVAVYWVCPVIGWLSAAALERRLRRSGTSASRKKAK